MLKGFLARLISIIKGIKIPQWILLSLIAILVLENISKMLNAFMERVRGAIESWRNPEKRQQQYRIEMPHALLGLVSVALAAVLLYLGMFKLILVIVTIFASAFYLRYRIMMDGVEQREAKRRRRLAKAQSTDKPEKRRILRSQPGSVDEEPVIRKEVYERQGSAPSLHGDTTDAAAAPPADLHSQFKGANAKLRRRLKDKLEERKDKLRQRKPLKTVLQNLKRSREAAGDTSDDGNESEDVREGDD